jgi:hypothetical protein
MTMQEGASLVTPEQQSNNLRGWGVMVVVVVVVVVFDQPNNVTVML